jgi:outer membrane receptor protein involved in Fe transport
MRSSYFLLGAVLAVGGGFKWATAAADAPAAAPAAELEEIVITAQKRTERLQDVAVSAVVLSTEHPGKFECQRRLRSQ